MTFSVRSAVLLLVGAAPLWAATHLAHATPDATVNITFSPATPTAGRYFVQWQQVPKITRYEIWEKRKGDVSSSLVGETLYPYWQFLGHKAGTFMYEIKACNASSCSPLTLSRWVDVTTAYDPTLDSFEPESTCGPTDPSSDVVKAWENHRAEQEKLIGPPPKDEDDDGLDPKVFGPAAWHIGIMEDTPDDLILWNPDGDMDGDCIPNYLDPFMTQADADGDGWYDGPCNKRWSLVLIGIEAHDRAEDYQNDEAYIVVDGARFPHSNNNDYWELGWRVGTVKNLDTVIAERTVGTLRTQWIAPALITGMEDDTDPAGNWQNDDTLFKMVVDMGGRTPGETFSVNENHGDWNYTLSFRIDLEYFADPDVTVDPSFPAGQGQPGFKSDSDGDGVSDGQEGDLSKWLGGRADPYRKDIWVEVDNATDKLHDRALWQVTTAFIMKDVRVAMFIDDGLINDSCISRADARWHYANTFALRDFPGIRHAMLVDKLFNGDSGVNVGRSFIVSTPTFHRPFGEERAFAGTFIHELGHSLGLMQTDFPLIDDLVLLNASYVSSMTYYYQPLIVEYSSTAGGFGDNFDDWEHIGVDPSTDPSSQGGFIYSQAGFGTLSLFGKEVCK